MVLDHDDFLYASFDHQIGDPYYTVELNIAAIPREFNLWLIVLHALMSLQFLQ